ncbi:MAG: TetR/AcrR family transcriptional regulator [Vampirovibrionales bacterium]
MGRRKKYENPEVVILDAAQELFHRYGFHRTTLEDISKITSLGKASIYQCFENKEAILLAVVGRSLTGLHQRLQAIVQAQCNHSSSVLSESDWEALLKTILFEEAWFKFQEVSAHFSGKDDFLLPPPIPPPKARQMFASWEAMFTGVLVEVLTYGVEQLNLQLSSTPENTAKSLRNAMVGFFPPVVLLRQLSPEAFKTELHQLLALLCKGIRR